MKKSICITIAVIFISFCLSDALAQNFSNIKGPYGGDCLSLAIGSKLEIAVGTTNGGFLSYDATNSWFRNGIWGNYASAVGIDKDGYIYGGSQYGVHVSSDNGKTWKWSLIKGNICRKIAIDDDNNVIYAGFEGGLFYVSTNKGNTWDTVNIVPGLLYHDVTDIAFHILNKINLGAYAISGGDLYKTTDNGKKWEKIYDTCFKGSMSSINIFGNSFYMTDGYCVYKSQNGTQWSRIDIIPLLDGIINCAAYNQNTDELYMGVGKKVYLFKGNSNMLIYDGSLNPGTEGDIMQIEIGGQFLYAATYGYGLIRVKFGNKSWEVCGVPQNINFMTNFGFDNSFLFTTDKGIFRLNLTDINNPNTDVLFLFPILSATSNFIDDWQSENKSEWLILCGGAFGMVSSEDNGKTFNPVNIGSPGIIVFFILRNTNGDFYASTNQGIFRSTDKAKTWSNNNIGLNSNDVRFMASDHLGNLYAASQADGIYFSSNNGKDWALINTGLDNFLFSFIGLGAKKGPLKLSDTNANDVILFTGTSSAVFRSTNFGAFWEKINGSISPIALLKNLFIDDNGDVLVGTESSGAYLTKDDGNSWTNLTQGLSINGITGFCTDTAGYLFISSKGNGLFRSNLPFLGIENEITCNTPKDLTLHPNPVSDYLSVSLGNNRNNEKAKIEIYSVEGIKVMDLETISEGSIKINISHLTQGIYFIKYNSKLFKFIKI